MKAGPLAGIRILDLTRVLAGPYCTMLLADMGADVIKIEEPRHGDETRAWAPVVDGRSLYFAGVNRSKRSVAIDLRSAAGGDVLRRLITTADVLIENLRPGGLARLGFGYEQVHALNPALVYCSISGYGRTGPRREEPGYDPVIQAESGLMDATGEPEGPPTRCAVPLADYLAGLNAIQGILLALMDRQRTGHGQHVDIALLDSVTSTMSLQNALVHVSGGAPYETLAAKDGLFMIAVGNQRQWRQCCDALGAPALADDPRFATNADRLKHRSALKHELETALRGDTVGEAVARLNAAQVPCGRVRPAADAFRDPQLASRNMFVDVGEPSGFRPFAHPVRFSAIGPTPARRPPALGEHTREVLSELGYSEAEIDVMCR